MSDLAGLEDAMGQEGQKPVEKRRKLKGYDLMPGQILNTMGQSGISNIDFSSLVGAMQQGNKAAAFFSELCDEDPGRKGVAISRLAEVWLLVGQKLKEPIYKAHVKKETYDKVITEFDTMKSHFEECMGKGISMDDKAVTVGRIAYSSGAEEGRDAGKVKAAAEKIYEWLKKKESPMRGLVTMLSAGGLFYVGQVHEKCHRAYVKSGIHID
jgi:hypothetical protein